MAASLDTLESKLRDQLWREGLDPERWSNGPHAVYGVHAHSYAKVLMVASGSVTFRIGEGGRRRVVAMKPGDRLELPARTPHGAVVGPEGVMCLEAHRAAREDS